MYKERIISIKLLEDYPLYEAKDVLNEKCLLCGEKLEKIREEKNEDFVIYECNKCNVCYKIYFDEYGVEDVYIIFRVRKHFLEFKPIKELIELIKRGA